MNLLPAQVQGGHVVVADHSLPAPQGLAEGHELIFGIRPESVQVGQGVPALVTLVEPTGSETVVTAELAGHAITVLSRDRQSLRVGQTLDVSPAGGEHHLFDAETGLRL